MNTDDETMPAPALLSSDRPLKDPGDDLLGHAPFAKALATSILRECPPDGLVVGIYGPWGTGKSTALNFLVHYLEQGDGDAAPIVLRFNPWWFGGQEDLIRRFFGLFEAAVFRAKAKRRKLKTSLAAFGSVFGAAVSDLPVPGSKTIARAVEKASEAGRLADVVALKAELVAELEKAALSIVIVIDDIDRLTADEIRQLFRLIKAVADFPNVTYVLAFDRDVAARALSEFHEGAGDLYLEKIVQVPFELPPPDRDQLRTMLFRRLDRLLAGTPDQEFDQQRFANVYFDCIRPFIQKPRDVVRLTNSLSVTFPAVKGEVSPIDFIGMETIRIFCPILYDVVRNNPDRFAGVFSSTAHTRELDDARAFHDRWLNLLGERRDELKAAVQRLFPRLHAVWGNTFHGTASWRNQRRLCSPDVFPVYFRLSVSPHSVSRAEFEAILSAASNVSLLGQHLVALADQKRPDGTNRARVFLELLNERVRRDKGCPPDAGSIVRALLEVGDQVVARDIDMGPMDLNAQLLIRFVLGNVLERMGEEDRVVVLKEGVSNGAALGVIAELVVRAASEHGRHGETAKPEGEHRVVPEHVVAELEQLVARRIKESAEGGTLVGHKRALRLLYLWRHFDGPSGPVNWVRSWCADDRRLTALLPSFIGTERSWGWSDHAATARKRADVGVLGDFFDLDELVKRCATIRDTEWCTASDQDVLAVIEEALKRKDGDGPDSEDE